MDWRRDGDYDFTAGLDGAGWAWQFLRRNPDYRADYAWFIATWRALEADYGAPPARDFFRWKQDARAWRAESELAACGTDACPGENDQVLIDCWMGAKWGFRKFPIDPAIDQPDELAWREQPLRAMPIESCAGAPWPPERVALCFDLGLPLDGQLEAARRELALRRHALAKAGQLPALGIRQGAAAWRLWLRLLDGLDAGAPRAQLGPALRLARPEADIAAAQAMCAGGYRRILMLPE